MKLTKQDFERLAHTQMAWNQFGKDWKTQVSKGRFEPVPQAHWVMSYWFIDYPSLLLARTYLEQEGYGYECFSDEWSTDYVIVTNFDDKRTFWDIVDGV
jgi:hypothetical protein